MASSRFLVSHLGGAGHLEGVLRSHLGSLRSYQGKIGDPNASCFELFLPWIHDLMLAYPEKEQGKDVPKSIPSRSLPHYYTKKIN